MDVLICKTRTIELMNTSLRNFHGAFLGTISVCAVLLSNHALFQFGEESARAVLIHGGGAGLVTCSDGSTFNTNISFTALSSNGTVAGNWTLYSFDTGNPGLVVGGPIYSGNLSGSEYQILGDSPDEQNMIALCSPPLFGPVTISGSCGHEEKITAHFRSNDPLSAVQTFTGSADCQSGDTPIVETG
jgi:hypothetical protein